MPKITFDKEVLNTATCSSCQRTFWATEAYVRKVREGAEVSLCGYCDEGDNDE